MGGDLHTAVAEYYDTPIIRYAAMKISLARVSSLLLYSASVMFFFRISYVLPSSTILTILLNIIGSGMI